MRWCALRTTATSKLGLVLQWNKLTANVKTCDIGAEKLELSKGIAVVGAASFIRGAPALYAAVEPMEAEALLFLRHPHVCSGAIFFLIAPPLVPRSS
jgi:hypothetical protein